MNKQEKKALISLFIEIERITKNKKVIELIREYQDQQTEKLFIKKVA